MNRLTSILLFFLLSITVRADQVGKASWYSGNDRGGKITASGERYSMNKLTAAHKTLPLGSIVRVTCLKNNKSVVVRINDRGPFIKGRVIDLSKKAAAQLNMLNAGVVKVKIEVLTKPLFLLASNQVAKQ